MLFLRRKGGSIAAAVDPAQILGKFLRARPVFGKGKLVQAQVIEDRRAGQILHGGAVLCGVKVVVRYDHPQGSIGVFQDVYLLDTVGLAAIDIADKIVKAQDDQYKAVPPFFPFLRAALGGCAACGSQQGLQRRVDQPLLFQVRKSLLKGTGQQVVQVFSVPESRALPNQHNGRLVRVSSQCPVFFRGKVIFQKGILAAALRAEQRTGGTILQPFIQTDVHRRELIMRCVFAKMLRHQCPSFLGLK